LNPWWCLYVPCTIRISPVSTNGCLQIILYKLKVGAVMAMKKWPLALQRKFFDRFAETHGIQVQEDWYKVKGTQFIRSGGLGFIQRLYGIHNTC
jgi:hypothetical protein